MGINLPASVDITAKVSGQSAIDQLKNSVQGLSKSTSSIKGAFDTASIAIKGFIAAYAIDKGVEFVKGILDQAEAMQLASEKTGFTVDSLNKLKVAGSLANVEFQAIESALGKFSVSISKAKTGSDDQANAFKAVGISLQQLKTSSPDDILFAVADKFKNLKDGPDKARLAVDLFGKAGRDLIPILNEGSDALKAYQSAFGDDFAARAQQFNDSLKLLKNSLTAVAVQGINELLPPLQEIVKAFTELPSAGKDSIDFFDAVGESLRYLTVGAETLIQGFLELVDAIKYVGGNLIDNFKTTYEAAKDIVHGNFSAIGQLVDDFNARDKKNLDDFLARTQERASAYAGFVSKLAKNSLVFGDGSVDDIKKRAAAETAPAVRPKGTEAADIDQVNKKVNEGIKFAQDKIRAINAETAAYTQNEVERKKAALDADLEQHGLIKGTAAYVEYKQKIEDAIDAQEKMKQSRDALFGQFSTAGAVRALNDYVEQAKNAAELTRNALTVGLKSMEDTLVDFFKTGVLNWRKFADDIITEIIRVQVKQNLIAPLAGGLSSLFGGGAAAAGGTATAGGSAGIFAGVAANGGIMTAQGFAPLNKYANGGIANSPQMAIFGEGRQPEAYVPLPDGRSIPVSLKGAEGGGSNTSVVVNVNMATGETQAASTSKDAAGLGRAVSSAVKAELIAQKRPGGLLAS